MRPAGGDPRTIYVDREVVDLVYRGHVLTRNSVLVLLVLGVLLGDLPTLLVSLIKAATDASDLTVSWVALVIVAILAVALLLLFFVIDDQIRDHLLIQLRARADTTALPTASQTAAAIAFNRELEPLVPATRQNS